MLLRRRHQLHWTAKRVLFSLLGLILWIIYTMGHLSSPPTKIHPQVNLVLALTKNQDSSWISKIQIPNLKIIPFIADDLSALYHPPASKGREAMMYLSYLVQFYDSLPDISIFTHGDDITWHIDWIFERSTANAINQLDLDEVLRRRYLNLRTDWLNACPAWINTTNSFNGSTGATFFNDLNHHGEPLSQKFEEAYMKGAFEENFPGAPTPEILAQPCCSQFAVSKEAIRSISKEMYGMQLDWLLNTPLSDQLTGRMWEHMWQYLFLKKAVDCPVEYKALCRGWHVCFESDTELMAWNAVAYRKEMFLLGLGNNLPEKGVIEKLDAKLWDLKKIAIERGRSRLERERIAGDL